MPKLEIPAARPRVEVAMPKFATATFNNSGGNIMLRLLAYLCVSAAVAGCAVEAKKYDSRAQLSEPEAGEHQAPVPPPELLQIHEQTNETDSPPDPGNTAQYEVKPGDCDFTKDPVRECSFELKQTLTVVGDRLHVRLPVCGRFEQDYEPPDPVHGKSATMIEFAMGGKSISVGSIYDTVIIRGTVVHEPMIRPPSDRSTWDGGINVVFSCLVYPRSKNKLPMAQR